MYLGKGCQQVRRNTANAASDLRPYYLLVNSQQKKIEYYQRDSNGTWQAGTITAEQQLQIACGDYEALLTFEDIYEDVEFE